MKDNNRGTCKTCIFWDRGRNHEAGTCRRNSPRAIAAQGEVFGIWPRAAKDEWCGQRRGQ